MNSEENIICKPILAVKPSDFVRCRPELINPLLKDLNEYDVISEELEKNLSRYDVITALFKIDKTEKKPFYYINHCFVNIDRDDLKPNIVEGIYELDQQKEMLIGLTFIARAFRLKEIDVLQFDKNQTMLMSEAFDLIYEWCRKNL